MYQKEKSRVRDVSLLVELILLVELVPVVRVERSFDEPVDLGFSDSPSEVERGGVVPPLSIANGVVVETVGVAAVPRRHVLASRVENRTTIVVSADRMRTVTEVATGAANRSGHGHPPVTHREIDPTGFGYSYLSMRVSGDRLA